MECQRILRHSLMVEPLPAMCTDFVDYFGNPAAAIAIERKHSELVIQSRARVDVMAPAPVDLAVSLPWEEVAAMFAPDRAPYDRDAIQYLPPTYYTAAGSELIGFAGASFTPGRPVLECAYELACRIYDGFTYDASATDTATSISEVLEIKRGVCQDFAHLLIGALRAFGLPGRYVSGYLLTRPPEGKERLVGADASHAWVSVWAPGVGWVDFDPTNNLIPADEHITIAYGRDFQDVSPVTGVLLGGGAHVVEVAVDVVLAPPATSVVSR
jgi:transglutaminase-like putative cysteine protease